MTRDTKTTRQDDKGKIERCIRGDGLSLSERIISEGSWRKQRSSCTLNEKEPGEPDSGPGGVGIVFWGHGKPSEHFEQRNGML